MDHTPLDQGMFLAGAFMAVTPMIISAIVLYVWWKNKKRNKANEEQDPSTSGRVS